MNTWISTPPHTWKVVEREGKFYCEQHPQGLIIYPPHGHGAPPPLRSYPFMTREWALACMERMQEMDHAFYTIYYSLRNTDQFSTLSILNWNPNALEFRLAGKDILIVDKNQNIVHLDLPYLVWSWLKNSVVVRGLKRFWYGERA